MAIIRVRNDDGVIIDIPAFVGPKGDPGADYVLTESDKAEIAELAAELVEVPEGGNGEDGFSPIATVEQTTDGAVITITDKDGTTTATVTNGKDGSDGVSATHSWNGTILTVTSASGTSSANLKGEKGDKGDSIKGDKGDTGASGTSVTVKSVSESTADGGSNVVTFSDGKIVTIKNGSKGSTGSNGTSVTVSNVSESSASGGTNTVTFSDGKKVNIKNGINGTNGTNGTNGKDGKTPVKGTDYWTPADQESIVQDVIAALGTPVFGRVDADNNIILTGNLAEGNSYTVKYEDAEGNVTEVGSIVFEAPPAYTNRLPLAIAADGTPYNGGQGWKTGTRLNSSGAESTSSADGIEVTGFIPVKSGDKIYLSGVTMNLGTKANQTYMWLYDSSFAKMNGRYRLFSQYSGEFDANKANGLIDVDEDGNITMITVAHDVFYTGANLADISNAAYLRISCEEINNNSIITVNEPIV